ncbi:MAG: tetratricopeptide repeat protein [Acidimicrobiia bacterium]|nr:tetratricopeptide repeat protein [Acidimicrobiia bacterium]
MGFWRKEVIEPALDEETRKHVAEQKAWIAAYPEDARPYHNLALLYRMQGRQEEALGLLLEAVRLDAGHAAAHVALCEIYAVKADTRAAWRHARLAERAGVGAAVELLRRHNVDEPTGDPQAG